MVVPFRQVVAGRGERRRAAPGTAPPSPCASSAVHVRGHPRPAAGAGPRRRPARRRPGARRPRHPLGPRRAADPRRRGRRRPHRRTGRRRRPAPAAHRRAPQLAVALAEAWTRRSEKRRTAQAEVLLGLIESAAKAQSMDHLLGDACRTARRARRGGAGLHLPARGRPARARAWPATPTAGATSPPGSSSATPRSASRSPRPSCAPASRSPPTATPGCCPAGGSTTSTSPPASPSRSAAAPHLAGVLTLDSTQVRPFSEDVRRLAAAAGAHLGGVIEQARTSQARAASLTTASVVRQMLVDGSKATGTSRGRRGPRPRRPAAGRHRPQRRLPRRRRRPDQRGHPRRLGRRAPRGRRRPSWSGGPRPTSPLWRLTEEQKLPVFVEDTATSDLLDPRLVQALDLASYVSVPLLSGDRLLGRRRHRLGVAAPHVVPRRPRGRAPGDPRGRAGRRERGAARGRAAAAGAAGHRGPPRPAHRPGQPPPAHRGAREHRLRRRAAATAPSS